MISTLASIVVVLMIFLILIYFIQGIVMMYRGPCGSDCYDEEETVTTTTTTVYHDEPINENRYNKTFYNGTLKKNRDSEGWFVIDPVDQEKIYVEEGHDQYTDYDGKFWKLTF